MSDSLKELIEKHLEVAKRTFAEDGEIPPMLIGYTEEKRIIMPLAFSGPEEKEMILRLATLVLVAEGATKYTVSFEGWSLDSNKCDPQKESEKLYSEGKSFADSPYRIEILSTMACSYDERRMVVYEILEDRSLKQTSEQDDYSSLKGRFFELLPPKKLSEEEVTAAKYMLKMCEFNPSDLNIREEKLH